MSETPGEVWECDDCVRRTVVLPTELAERLAAQAQHGGLSVSDLLAEYVLARRELEHCRSAIHDAIGAHSNLFRPPFGGRRPAVLRIARELGFETIMWNVTGYDWNAPPAAEIEQKITRQIRGGDVILLHDGGHKQMGADRSQTVIATDHLITRYKSEGYEFVTIPLMMANSDLRPPLEIMK